MEALVGLAQHKLVVGRIRSDAVSPHLPRPFLIVGPHVEQPLSVE